ncbi:MAG: hypothetical protein EXS63_05035 [Candidatus Omnitrophica bacterium]|nr:hypothetical protein [Candidatus Omnitrophota bacterium]
MILGQKKTQDQDQEKNWCIVLNSMESEMDRKRMAAKISEVFGISTHEAHDLVRSTPIILLDHLTKLMAVQIKDYFSPMNAELVLSKDTLFKRKCYRTLWPQPPSLAFLHQRESETAGSSSLSNDQVQDPLHPEDALDEIRRSMELDEKALRSFSMPPSAQDIPKKEETRKPSFTPFSYSGLFEKQKMREDKEQEKGEEKEESKPRVLDFPVPTLIPAPPLSSSQEHDLTQVRKTLQSVEDRYQALTGEYRDSRHIFEEKISEARRGNESLHKKIEEVLENYQGLQKEKKQWMSEFQEKESSFLRIAEQSKNTVDQQQKEYIHLAKEMERLSAQFLESRARLEQSESVQQNLESLFARLAQESKAAFEKWQKESGSLTQSVESVSLQALESTSRLERLEEAKQILESSFEEQQTHLASFKSNLDQLEKGFKESLQRENQEKSMRERLEKKQLELETAHAAFKHEITSETQDRVQTEFKGLNFDKKFDAFHELFQKQYGMLDAILKHLLVRESQRGLVEIPAVAAENSGDEKKLRLAARTADQQKHLEARLRDKESMLKHLVTEQKKIEQDIHDREEEMRRVITEQEKVEEEIVEVRQVQRQWNLPDKSR